MYSYLLKIWKLLADLARKISLGRTRPTQIVDVFRHDGKLGKFIPEEALYPLKLKIKELLPFYGNNLSFTNFPASN